MGLLGGLVGGGVGGAIGGLFGGPDPTYNKQALSDTGQKALSDVDTNANRSVADRTASQMEGTQAASDTYKGAMSQAKPEDINTALQDRLNKTSDIQMNRLRRQTGIDAATQRGVDIMTAANFHQQKYQLDRSQSDAMLNQARQKDANRSQIIGSIAGSLGQFAGQGIASMRAPKSIMTAGGGPSFGNTA